MRTVAGHPSSTACVAGAERADDQFFAALLAADKAQLVALLADEFLIIDVAGGSLVDRDGFIHAVGSGVVQFSGITIVERATRRYGDAAVVVGRTRMAGSLGGAGFEVASRYTHVLARDRGGPWRLVNAQGTQIAAEPPGGDRPS